MPRGQHPRKRKSVATKGQHGHQYLTVVAHPQSEDVEGISPHVLDEKIPQEGIGEATRPHQPEGISPQQPVERGSQEETETLNV